MREITAFDFDGTLTRKDTFVAFIRFVRGDAATLFGFLRYLPLLVLMKLRLYPNWKAKQRVFAHFFQDMPLSDFDSLCRRFADANRHLLRPDIMRQTEERLAQGQTVVIVSASIRNWVEPFFGAGVAFACTEVEVADGRLTGRFLTPNCYGPEKVRRLLALYPDRTAYRLTAYGDSRGDRELLAFADESHYQP